MPKYMKNGDDSHGNAKIDMKCEKSAEAVHPKLVIHLKN